MLEVFSATYFLYRLLIESIKSLFFYNFFFQSVCFFMPVRILELSGLKKKSLILTFCMEACILYFFSHKQSSGHSEADSNVCTCEASVPRTKWSFYFVSSAFLICSSQQVELKGSLHFLYMCILFYC